MAGQASGVKSMGWYDMRSNYSFEADDFAAAQLKR